MRKQILCAVWSAALVLLCGTAARGVTTTTISPEPQMDDYIYPPIFQSSSVLPNIMIILDHSGSMCFPAYPDPYNPDEDDPQGNVTGSSYEGNNCKTAARVGSGSERGSDDAVELATSAGTMNISATSLTMTRPTSGTSEYIVGLRFPNVQVPKDVHGAPVTITKATITFMANSASGASTDSLTFYGQNSANPATFTSTAKNISTGRTWLTPTVTWSSATLPAADKLSATWAINTKYTSPDLKTIVSQMVQNADWAAGNAMVFKITGTAGTKRYPKSFDGDATLCPTLVIEYTPCNPKQYYGYFVSSGRYVYNTTTKKFERTYATPVPGDSSWSGNFLNWICMRRFDVLKRALIGGKRNVEAGTLSDNNTLLGEGAPSSASGSASTGNTATYYWQTYYKDNTTDAAPQVSPYTEAWYGMKGGFLYVKTTTDPINGNTPWTSPTASFRIAVQKSRTNEPDDYCTDDNGIVYNVCGIMQKIGTQAQWGNHWFYDTVPVNAIGTPIPQIVRTLETKVSENSTPVATAISNVTTYFKGGTSKGDPFKDKQGNILPCAKSYILLLTDGVPNTDPSSYTDYDGDGNDAAPAGNIREYDAIDDFAFYAHTTDLRSATVGASAIDGIQSIDSYVVYAFGKSNFAPVILRETAINGGFKDLNGNGKPDGYGKTPTASYGSNPLALLSAFTQYDADERGEWDKDGDGVPDNYYEAQNGDEIEDKVLAAINDILNKAASGTAVSVLATTGEGEGTLVQAIFLPSKVVSTYEVNWLGRLQALWVDAKGNIREDTTADKKLDVTNDNVITYSMVNGETMVKRYTVSAAVPYPDTTTAVGTTILLENIKPIWEAGVMLENRAADDRKIYTYVGNGSVMAPAACDGSVSSNCTPFTLAKATVLRPFLGIELEATGSYSYLDGTNALYRADNLIEYIRGKDWKDLPHQAAANTRNRSTDGGVKVWKLGDIVYSTPVTISKPVEKYDIIYDDATYRAFQAKYGDNATTARETMTYVGANDGMLHAFTSGVFNKTLGQYQDTAYADAIGDEVWAYIPQPLLPHLKWLADPKYVLATHVPFVDLKPKVIDVRIFATDTDHPYGWGTVLIGGMNFGGKHIWTNDASGNKLADYYPSFFAIDITNPRNPRLLWDKSFPNMGFSLNAPTVMQVGRTFNATTKTWNSDDHWYLAIGSGFDTFDGLIPSYSGSLYIVDILTGALLKQFPTTENAYMNTPLAIDKGLNYSVDALYVAGNYQIAAGVNASKVWRLGTPITTTPYVEGKDARYQWNPALTPAWSWTTLLQSSTGTGAITLPAISAPFTISSDTKDNVWIYGGTGRFQVKTDKTNSATNMLFGVKDPFYNRLGVSKTDTTTPLPCYHNYAPTDASCFLKLDNLFYANPYTIKPNDVVVTNSALLPAGQNAATTWTALMNEVKRKATTAPTTEVYKGWRRNLQDLGAAASERVVNKPTAYGGIALFPSYSPDTNACSYGGSSNLYALYYASGTAYHLPVLTGLNNTVTIQDTFFLGYGLSSSFGIHAAKEKGDTATVYSQMSTGVINAISVKPAMDTRSGIEYWKEGR